MTTVIFHKTEKMFYISVAYVVTLIMREVFKLTKINEIQKVPGLRAPREKMMEVYRTATERLITFHACPIDPLRRNRTSSIREQGMSQQMTNS